MSQEFPHHRSTEGKQTASSEESVVDHQGGALELPKIVSFKDLTHCGEELWIEHHGQLYRLRQTKAGKLILTK